MAKTPNWKIECFMDHFPDSQWKRDLIFGPNLGTSSYCKICDKYIHWQEIEKHLKNHIKEKENIKKIKRKEANERKMEALKLAREAKKLKKEGD